MSNNSSKKDTTGDIILQVKNICKIYQQGQPNEVKAIDNISFEVKRGEIISIMGPSGCGKTTLLNCISGIDNATSGEINLDGSDLQKMNDGKKTKYRASKMGFIFQTFNLIPVLSALENVQLPLLLNGLSDSASEKKAKEMLDIVGLSKRMNHKPNELSGGQRQRVTIARALVHKPSIIWADEATGNLDSHTAQEIIDLMIKMNKELNETFVLVTHDPNIASKTQRTLRIQDGKLLG